METAKTKVEKMPEENNGPMIHEQVNGQQIADCLLGRNIIDEMTGSQVKQDRNIELQETVERNNQLYELHYDHELASSIPIIGKIIIVIKKVIRRILFFLIQPVINEQNIFNASVTQSVNGLFEEIQRQKEISFLRQKEVSQSNKQLAQQQEKIEQLNKQLEAERKKNESNQNSIYEIHKNMKSQHEILTYLKKKEKKERSESINTSFSEKDRIYEEKKSNVYQEMDYFLFENAFRGSKEDIRGRQEEYLKYFAGKQNIVDLGCGRGEFLSLLKENGISATGVDMYEEFVEYGNEEGLRIEQGDAVEFLSRQVPEGLGGIFCAQLVEHLQPGQIMEICALAYEKLEKGGCIIFETPNPCCLSIYTNAFYIDPSHMKPVHPETMKYYLKQAGFFDIELVFTESSKIPYQLPLLDAGNVKNLAEFNSGIQLISDLLFGSQDYAVIAYR